MNKIVALASVAALVATPVPAFAFNGAMGDALGDSLGVGDPPESGGGGSDQFPDGDFSGPRSGQDPSLGADGKAQSQGGAKGEMDAGNGNGNPEGRDPTGSD